MGGVSQEDWGGKEGGGGVVISPSTEKSRLRPLRRVRPPPVKKKGKEGKTPDRGEKKKEETLQYRIRR